MFWKKWVQMENILVLLFKGKLFLSHNFRHEEQIPETIENQENQADEVVENKIPRKAIYRLNTICYGVPLNRFS